MEIIGKAGEAKVKQTEGKERVSSRHSDSESITGLSK